MFKEINVCQNENDIMYGNGGVILKQRNHLMLRI